MDKAKILNAIKSLKGTSKKRNFNQSYDLIINLKGVDLKKTENQIDMYATLHYPKGKKVKVCVLCGPELLEQAKTVCDKAIAENEFEKYARDKKEVKLLAKEYKFFIAQANLMPKVATSFGKVLGPRKKMPDPKAGCIIPPKANLKLLYDNLQKTVRIIFKENTFLQIPIGNEEMPDEQVIDNILTVYNTIIHHLPGESQNIRSILLKLTMSKPVKIS